MKQFTTLKVGYTSGIYGCSNEFFTTIYIDTENIDDKRIFKFFSFYGMYGAEERVARALKDKGYEEQYIPTDYGKMKTREVWKGFISEQQAIKLVNEMGVNHDTKE